ncbi:MAG: hypothetical protein ACYSUM_06390, partial [Planctomycetota bacterium]
MTWARIETRVRPAYTDPAGVAALADLRLAGLEARSVRVHQVFFLRGATQEEDLAQDLFIDPVLEEAASGGGAGVAVSVCKRPGVMDPAEASILRAARALGDRP